MWMTKKPRARETLAWMSVFHFCLTAISSLFEGKRMRDWTLYGCLGFFNQDMNKFELSKCSTFWETKYYNNKAYKGVYLLK